MSVIHDNSGKSISLTNPLHILQNTASSQAVLEGRAFFISNYWSSITAGTSVYVESRIGSKVVVVVARNLQATGSLLIQQYENPTYTQSSTPVFIANVNRTNPLPSVTTTWINPTAVTGGTLVSQNYMLSNQGVNTLIQSSAQGGVLAPNTKYVTKITNTGTGTIEVNWDVLYYEV